MVDGDSGEYAVEIEVDQKSGELYFECDCPYAEEHFCKHMVAAALELSDFLKEDGSDFDDEEEDEEEEFVPTQPSRSSGSWQNKLNETLAQVPQRASSGNVQRYIALVLLTRFQFGYSGYGNPYWASYSYSLEPFMIRQNEWNELGGSQLRSVQEINEFLGTNKKWLRSGERVRHQLSPAGCINLAPDAVAMLNFLNGIGSVYSISSGMSMYLSMIARLDIPIFLGSLQSDKAGTAPAHSAGSCKDRDRHPGRLEQAGAPGRLPKGGQVHPRLPQGRNDHEESGLGPDGRSYRAGPQYRGA